MSSKYRSQSNTGDRVIAFSLSYEKENLLARGLGLEHLREMLIRLARPILRNGASLAYGGQWDDTEENFTYDLLNLINAEQQDNSLGGPDTDLKIGRLYNHLAWPSYQGVTPAIEAKWINCCQIVRVSREEAGVAPDPSGPGADAKDGASRSLHDAAACLSAMRRSAMEHSKIRVPDLEITEPIPPVAARIMMAGKESGYRGFMPGIFEEALVTLEKNAPLFLLGGFGGATEVLAEAILGAPGSDSPELLTIDWHRKHSDGFAELLDSIDSLGLPPDVPHPEASFEALWEKVELARANPSGVLNCGLDDTDTRALLETRDMDLVVRLVRGGISDRLGMEVLPA